MLRSRRRRDNIGMVTLCRTTTVALFASVAVVACGSPRRADAPAPTPAATPAPPKFAVGDKVRINGFVYFIHEDSQTAIRMATVCDNTEDKAPAATICDKMRRWITKENTVRSCATAKVENIVGQVDGLSARLLQDRWYYVSGCDLADFMRVHDQALVKEADLNPRK